MNRKFKQIVNKNKMFAHFVNCDLVSGMKIKSVTVDLGKWGIKHRIKNSGDENFWASSKLFSSFMLQFWDHRVAMNIRTASRCMFKLPLAFLRTSIFLYFLASFCRTFLQLTPSEHLSFMLMFFLLSFLLVAHIHTMLQLRLKWSVAQFSFTASLVAGGYS